MNILFLNSEKSWRGGEQQLAYLINGLKEDISYEISVMGRAESQLEKWCNQNKINFIPARFNGSADLLTSVKIVRVCRKLKINMMHAQTSHAHAAALYSTFIGNTSKLILHRRVSFPIKSNFISKFKYTSNRVAKIICISKDVQSVVTKTTQQPERTAVVYDAIDSERFAEAPTYDKSFTQRYNLPKSKFIVANTSALSTEKDYFTFIDTAKECVKAGLDCIFLIAGEGDQRQNIENYIKANDLEHSIFLLGFINDISDILDHIDALLVTSKQEGLGSSILDAFYKEVPVVATAAGGIPEIVIHNETGMLAKIGATDILAKYLTETLENTVLSSKLKKGALCHLNKHFLSSNMVKNTKKIYGQLL